MIELLLALVAVILSVKLVSFWKWQNSDFVKIINQIPGPPKLPIFGNLLSIPSDRSEILPLVQTKWVKEYGPIYKFWIWSRPLICVSSKSAMETLLTSQKFIDKGDSYDQYLQPLLGNGLILATGEQWRRSRRMLTPAFHFKILDNFFDVFNKNAEILCHQITTTITKKNEVDMFFRLKRCTLDIICETAMGISINAQTEDSDYITSVRRMAEIISDLILSLWQYAPNWIYYNFSSLGREHIKHLNKMHDFTNEVIQKRKREINLEDDLVSDDQIRSSMGIKKKRAFLDLMLIEAKKGADLSDSDIRNEVGTFMFAGHDTTAVAMTWFLYCMGNNPDKQALVHEELDQVFGDSDRPCTMEDASQLKYLECCIKETLRLYPSVPVIERRVTEEIELDGFKIPVGTTLSLLIYALHQNEENFPDASSFKPERFLDGERNPFSYVPFSAGPRNCIGQRFALLEEKVVLSTILRKFCFTYDVAKNGPAQISVELVLNPLSKMNFIVHPRR